MSVIPTTTVDEIQFGEVHAPVWAGSPTAIGLSASACTAITAAVSAARKAFNDAMNAREASKSYTNALKTAMDNLHPLMAEAVQTIRLYAESTGNNDVYTKAQIPPPAAPSPAPPPLQPVQLGASILPSGALRIAFKATDPAAGATTYLVSRKLAGETTFTVIGSAGSSRTNQGVSLPRGFKFLDDGSLPVGSNNMQYMVQGQRGSVFGPSSEALVVKVGVVGGGGGLAVTSTELRMAA